jgi:hypothetical protein
MAEKKKAAGEKPLDKMTVKELKEIALEIPDITGVHGMNKQDLIAVIKEERGIVDEKKSASSSVRDIKKRISAFKIKRQEALAAKDDRMAQIYRRRISRLKKRSRQAA